MARNKYYRLDLVGSGKGEAAKLRNMQFFDVKLSDEYKIKFLDKRGKLGSNHLGHLDIPELHHTKAMLEDGWVCQSDEDGRFETPDDSQESKELAKMILRACIPFAAIDPISVDPRNTTEVRNQKIVAYWAKLIDKSSPKDLLEELTKELNDASAPKGRTSRLEERKLAAAEASKVK
jgi:hypothetical protein